MVSPIQKVGELFAQTVCGRSAILLVSLWDTTHAIQSQWHSILRDMRLAHCNTLVPYEGFL
jgi:hypothetical protein